MISTIFQLTAYMRYHNITLPLLIAILHVKIDLAEEENIVFMLEETCNRIKLGLVQAQEYIIVRSPSNSVFILFSISNLIRRHILFVIFCDSVISIAYNLLLFLVIKII